MDLTRRAFGALAATTAGIALFPRFAGAATTSHGISAFGDLKYAADFAHFDFVNPDAPKGGAFSTGFGGITYDSFNPFILKGNPAFYMGLTWDTLMVASPDEADARYGLIASDAEMAEDRSWVVFNLRPEARFHDGTPITADDIVWTYETLITKGHPSYRIEYGGVASAAAEGPHRVRFDFKPDVPKRDMPMQVSGLPALSRKWFETRDFAESSLEPPLTSGPYKVGKFEPGKYVAFERVKDYWAADLPVNRGRWNFDEIRLEYFRDRTAAFEAFKGGAFLFNEEFTSKNWATAYEPGDFPAIARGDVIRDVLPDNRPAGAQGFWFNLRRTKLQDPRVRQAIGLAFDFEWSNKRLFYDLYKRTDSFFELGPMQAEGPPSPAELAILERFADQVPPELLTKSAYIPPVTDGSGRNRRALRTAGKLLDDAGWKIVDGVRQKDGETLEIEFLMIQNSGFARIAQPMIKNLEKIGIAGSIREVDPPQYRKRNDDFDFDIVVDRKGFGMTPGVGLRDSFHSSSANSAGSDNTAGVADPVVDALIDIIERATSREDLKVAVMALDRVLRAKHIWVPQWHKGSHTLAYWDIYARPATKPLYARGVLDTWWVDTQKLQRLKDAGRL